MSATPPYGPAYDEQPEDGQRPGTGQWQPRAGRPQGAQGDPGQYQSGPRAGGPQAGGPQAGGQRPVPQAGRPSQDPRGGAPRAGGPSAGRGPQQGGQGGFQGQRSGQGQSPQQPGPGYGGQSPQQFSPQYGGYESRRPQGPVTGATPRAERQDQWGAGSPPRAGSPAQAPQGAPQASGPGGEPLSRKEQPFEETAFADESRGEWGGGSETTTIGRLGYMPKEPRRRSDFQKVRSRARKSSPIPKIIGGVVALALVGGGVWWFMNRDEGSESTGGTETNLTFEGSSEPCSLVDASPLEAVVNGAEPTMVGEGEDKSRGWVQSCSMTYGEAERATALLEVESTVFDSDAKASVNFELGTSDIGELGEAWTLVEPAPEIGDQSAAVSRVPEDGGTSNFHLHVQDDNTYMVVRLSVAEEAGMDQQGLTELALAIANGYLENWRDAS